MIRLVFGRPRSGKTTLVRSLMRERARVLFVDPFPVPNAIEIWQPEDCLAVNWHASKLRIAWPSDPDYGFFETLSDIDLVIDDPDGEAWKGGIIRDIALRRIITRCGHYSQRITIISQRPSLVPVTVRSLAVEVYGFALTDPRDRDVIFKQWGIRVPSASLQYQAWFADAPDASQQPKPPQPLPTKPKKS